MDTEKIKKIISESNEEFINKIIEKIQSQIKEEQEKINEKAKVTKIKKSTKEELESYKKAHAIIDKSMDQYISETKKIQDMMKNVKNNTKNELNKNQINSKVNLKPYFNFQRINDNTICDIYTNFPENLLDINYSDMRANIKRLNSFLDSNVENLNNWYFDELCDRDIPNRGISENLSAYFYEFLENESKSIKNDSINSYIYIDFDDILKKMTIYIINYNNLNYKIYDFYKWIFALKDNASDEDLYNYFLNVNIQFPYDDYITEHIGKYIITYQDKTIYSTKNTVTENLKDIILSIIKSHNVNSYNTKAFNFFKKWSNIDKDDDIFDHKEVNKKNDFDILKEYSKQSSENINISSSDNTLKVEINSSKDKIDKIKLLLHLAMDGFIEVKYNNGKILLNIDGNFVCMDNPYWE